MHSLYLPVIAVVLALAGCEQQGAQHKRTDSAATGDYIAAPTAAPPPPIAFEAGGKRVSQR
jgi:hypothetical protein